jgi:uncharacterized damage-inducible protein DinB
MMNAIPTDKMGKKIHQRFRSAGELAMHIGDTVRDLTATLKSGKLVFTMEPTAVPSSAESILKHYEAAMEEFQREASQFTESQMTKKYPFEMGGKVVWEPTGYELMSGYICHEIHHRAQIGVVLRLLDAKVPGMYGPSGDEM